MFLIKYMTTVIVLSISIYTILMYCEVIKTSSTFIPDIEIIQVTRSSIFDLYLKKFNKSYSEEEYPLRLRHFRASMREISRLNRETGAKHGWTRFTDMYKEEISKFILVQNSEPVCHTHQLFCTSDHNTTIIPQDIPNKVDWRKKDNVITPVVNQLMCAACWAISIVETMGAMAAIRGLGTSRLSIQELLDCSEYNTGCSGGNMQAMEYLCYNDLPITTEDEYPLTLINESCDRPRIHGGRRIKKFSVQCPMDEYDMLRVLAHHGPIVVVINAGPLMSYMGGIIQRNCERSHDGRDLMHMVQIVGYDRTGDIPYYIAKNSWGEEYGDDGYVKLAVNRNICGVAEEVGYLDVY